MKIQPMSQQKADHPRWPLTVLMVFSLLLFVSFAVVQETGIHFTGLFSSTSTIRENFTRDVSHNTVLPLVFDESPTSFTLSGRLLGKGNVRVELVTENNRYLVYTINAIHQNNLLTGLVVDDDVLQNTGLKMEGNESNTSPIQDEYSVNDTHQKEENNITEITIPLPENETTQNYSLSNTTNEEKQQNTSNTSTENNVMLPEEKFQEKEITVHLAYQSGTQWDVHDNGIEAATQVIDLSLEKSQFNWNADESKVCTKWTVTSSTEKAQYVCAGSATCCAFLGLTSGPGLTYDSLQIYEGLYGADANSTISAQILYYDVDLNLSNLKTDIIYSGRQSLPVRWVPIHDVFVFEDRCHDSCRIDETISEAQLEITLEGDVVLELEQYQYTYYQDQAPRYFGPENITILENENYTANLTSWFIDPEGKPVLVNVVDDVNLNITYNETMLTIVPDVNFTGIREILLSGSDGTKIKRVRIPVVVSEEKNLNISEIPRIQFRNKAGHVVSLNTTKNGHARIQTTRKKHKMPKIIPGLLGKAQVFEEKITNRVEIYGIQKIRKKNISITGYLDEINDSQEEGMERSITTDVVALPTFDFDNASITLQKRGEVTALLECPEFDFENSTCVSWQLSQIPFVDNGTHITFAVTHFSGYAGANITIINVQSYPLVNDYWTVRFHTIGRANLTLVAIGETTFAEYPDDDPATEDDLLFSSLWCGNESLEFNRVQKGTRVVAITYPNYTCSEEGRESSLVLTSGVHDLQFTFGTSVGYAHNDASNAPEISDLSLGTPSGGNDTTENLTVTFSASDADEDDIKNITTWWFNGSLIHALNMPFEGNLTAEGDTKVRDYAHGNNGTINATFWNATAGYDGFGAFEFDGSESYISIDDDSALDSTGNLTISLWVKPNAFYQNNRHVLIKGGHNVTRGNTSASTDDVTFYGISGADASGRSVGMGDFNNDGISDLVVGANYAEGAGGTSNTEGETYVLYGPITTSGEVSLSNANVTYYGVSIVDRSAEAVGSGDFNNDGIDDLIITAPNAEGIAGTTDREGENYLFYGPLASSGEIILSDANVTYYGISPVDESGTAVTSADVNHDGIDDVILGSMYAENADPFAADSGEAYIFYGPAPVSGTVNLSDANITIYGRHAYDFSSASLDSGDLNGDGIDDLIIGGLGSTKAPASTVEGEVYVLYGPLSTGNRNLSTANVTYRGKDSGDSFGKSVAVCDFNADGVDDLIVGANEAEGIGGTSNSEGEVYVIYGPTPASGYISSFEANFTYYGITAEDYLGTALSCGDLNGDGLSDLVAGAHYAEGAGGTSNGEGETYVFFGPMQFTNNYDVFLSNTSVVFAVGDQAVKTTAPISMNEYSHIAAVYDGSTMSVYINGELNATETFTETVTTNDFELTIGSFTEGFAGTFNGTIDDVHIYNRSFASEQIVALYTNKTSTIVSSETIVGDIWKACVTPNDGFTDGDTVCSADVTVQNDTSPPSVFGMLPSPDTSYSYPDWVSIDANVTDALGVDTVYANLTYPNSTIVTLTLEQDGTTERYNYTYSTLQLFGTYNVTFYAYDVNGYANTTEVTNFTVNNATPNMSAVFLESSLRANYTSENLTLFFNVSDSDGYDVKNITIWYRNNTPITVLNMPFESDLTAEGDTKIRDYALGNNGTVYGATWNVSAGYDGFGAYLFDGETSYLSIPDDDTLDVTTSLSISFWIEPTSYATTTRVLMKGGRNGTSINVSASNDDVTYYGKDTQDSSGSAVGSGDYNYDGIEDLIIGAPYAEGVGGTTNTEGETYIVYGPVPSSGEVDLSNANVTFYGITTMDRSGSAVGSGDFNNDGIDDVIIGAPYAEGTGGTTDKEGETYIFYGPIQSSGEINLADADVIFYGVDVEDYSGSSVGSGDVNNDGIDDVLIGAPYADGNGLEDAGEVYVVFGPTSTGAVSLSTYDALFYGMEWSDMAGRAVASGDVNGDGIDDLLVGAHFAEPGSFEFGKAGDRTGEIYVLYGPIISGDHNLSTANVTYHGASSEDFLGYSVGSCDFNSDGYEDIIMGTYGAEGAGGTSNDEGEAYLWYGPIAASGNYNVNASNITYYGINTDDYLGTGVACGDLNDDGFGDAIVSAIYAEGAGGTSDREGETYITFGPTQRNTNYELFLNNASLVFAVGNEAVKSTAKIPLHTFSHITATFEGSNLNIYINGELDANKTFTGTVNANAFDLTIGSFTEGFSTHLNGTIDEVLIFNRSLTQDQIALLYTNASRTLSHSEISSGEVWHACVTPTNSINDGLTTCSNNITILNEAPSVLNITGIESVPVYENQVRKLNFSVIVEDNCTVSDIQTVNLTITSPIGVVRTNDSCTLHESVSSVRGNYSCALDLAWFDTPGTWIANATALDAEGDSAGYLSATFMVQSVVSIEVGPNNITWAQLTPGLWNQTATVALVINNTGNANITPGSFTINATDLLGQDNASFYIPAFNFSIGPNTEGDAECGLNTTANQTVNNTDVYIGWANLSRGNYTSGDGTAQEELYICLRQVPSTMHGVAFKPQSYVAAREWIITAH